MKLSTLLATLTLAAGSSFFAASASAGGPLEFNFTLDGSQEVPANNSNAVGAGQILYDPVTNIFSLDLMVFGITLDDLLPVGPNSTPVHIHFAPPGSNGPIVVDVGWMSSFQNDGQGIRLRVIDELFGGQQGNLFTDPEDNEDALLSGNLYINVHTTAFPGGEIRGNIPAIPAPGAIALFGAAGLLVKGRRRRT